MAKIFYEILNKDQAHLFPKLKFLSEKGFYLAGGTALALHLLASILDIAAMKLIALTGRAKKRDYIDIFYLLEKLSLGEMFKAAKKKYSLFNPYIVKRALAFFDDVEEENGRIEILDKNFSWKKAKEKIFSEVRRYQLAMIKKNNGRTSNLLTGLDRRG